MNHDPFSVEFKMKSVEFKMKSVAFKMKSVEFKVKMVYINGIYNINSFNYEILVFT